MEVEEEEEEEEEEDRCCLLRLFSLPPSPSSHFRPAAWDSAVGGAGAGATEDSSFRLADSSRSGDRSPTMSVQYKTVSSLTTNG